MINFNKNTAWNLTPINLNSIHNEVAGLMVNGERPLMAFKTIGLQENADHSLHCPTPRFSFLRSRHPASWSWFPTQNCSSILRMDLKPPLNSEEMWI